MKKLFLSLALIPISYFTSFSQDNNKPEANSFGLQYGVNFNGTIGQAVQLSGWLKNGIEVRGSMAFSYTNTQTSSVYNGSYTIFTPDGRNIPAIQSTASSSAALTVTPTISVVKHFPLKSNLDFFIGASANCGFTTPTAWTKNSNTETADSFYSFTSTNTKAPLSINWGMSVVGGANYFFYKNLAIGADFGVGFSATNGNGNSQEQQVAVNSGQNNTNTANYTKTFNNQVSNTRYVASLTGNAGLHLTYYLKVKNKKQSADQKM
jgi:hypothetical protein